MTDEQIRVAETRGYSKGYAAGIKRVKALEMELRDLKDYMAKHPLPDSHDTTIEYLLTTAEAFTVGARMLIGMRSHPASHKQMEGGVT